MTEPLKDRQSVPQMSLTSNGDECLTLSDSPRGTIELPTVVYELIAADLPKCLQRGDDDRCSTPHHPSLPLRQKFGQTTKLQTRNTELISNLLYAKGLDHRVRYEFNDTNCALPGETADIVLSSINLRATHQFNSIASLKRILNCYRAGQLVSHDNQRKFDDAAILCCLYPLAPIVLVVASDDEVELAASELEQRLPEGVHRAFGNHARPECRITVATYRAFRSVGLCDAPFVIVPIWNPGYPRWMRMISWGPWRDRIYFLRTAGEPLSEKVEDDLVGRVGPVLLQPRKTPRSSTTFSCYKFGGTRPAENSRQSYRSMNTPIDKRKLYWRHRRRNQAIAALARHVDASDGAIAVLLETAEHAEAVSKLLPGWLVVTKDSVPADASVSMIITLTAAAEWKQFRPRDLVIGIGGAPSPWLLEWLSEMSRNGHAVRIIELTDGFEPTAAELATARLNSYREAGMHWRPLSRSGVQSVNRELRAAEKHEKSSRRSRCASR